MFQVIKEARTTLSKLFLFFYGEVLIGLSGLLEMYSKRSQTSTMEVSQKIKLHPFWKMTF